MAKRSRAMYVDLKCMHCAGHFSRHPYVVRMGTAKFCSVACKSRWYWSQQEYVKKQSISHKGITPSGLKALLTFKRSAEGRKQMSDRMKGKVPWNKGMHSSASRPRSSLHRGIVEGIIKRKLLSNEVVHHIDKDRRNNTADNLFIFRHHAAHMRWHHFLERHNLLGAILISNLQEYAGRT